MVYNVPRRLSPEYCGLLGNIDKLRDAHVPMEVVHVYKTVSEYKATRYLCFDNIPVNLCYIQCHVYEKSFLLEHYNNMRSGTYHLY